MNESSFELQPQLGGQSVCFFQFCKKLAQSIQQEELDGQEAVLWACKEDIARGCEGSLGQEDVALLAAKSLLLDLVGHGWQIRIQDTKVVLHYSDNGSESKDSVRRRHLVERNAQLREKSVQDFIKRIERRRLTSAGWHSIFSLMRDGEGFSDQLRLATRAANAEEKGLRLSQAVMPYLQFVDGNAVCEHTGLKLRDIWRYFRHTWVNSYKSLPGRSIMILVRDAAATNHPVIGIAALGSSVIQQTIRDRWIGWDPTDFVEGICQAQTAKTAKWLLNWLDALIENLYLQDLLEEHVCCLRDLQYPTDAVISRLQDEGDRARQIHQRFPDRRIHKRTDDVTSNVDWRERARTPLFKSKRCRTLAQLLSIRKIFQTHGLQQGTRAELTTLVGTAAGRKAIGQLGRRIKAENVGIKMMDVTVCGSVAPYNIVLGGKLVSMMICSPEVVRYYRDKYRYQPSIIASSMKGEATCGRSDLVFLGTTSLYAIGSSQYNRVRVPADEVGGRGGKRIEYVKLGLTEGFGSFHFSRETLRLMSVFVAKANGGQRVNSIFGEGANPLMRKIRDALDMLGLPSDLLLQHCNRRVVYGIALAENFRDILMGIHQRPRYIIPQSQPQHRTDMITECWRRRWLASRIHTPGVLDEIAEHILSYPMEHGARVPRVHSSGGQELFPGP